MLLTSLLAAWSVACRGAPSARTQTEPPGEGSGAEHPTEEWRDLALALHMGNYFWMVIEARDALIAGSLNRAKSRMRSLSEQPYESLVPAAWHGDMDRMVDAAARAGQAADLHEASEALAEVAVACGTCHAKLHTGPLPNTAPVTAPDPGTETATDRMLRHQWAADALWAGLTLPSDAEWREGAQALVDAPPQPPGELGDGSLSHSQQTAMENVRQVGQLALTADDPEQRASLYATLLRSCSSCHGTF